MNIPTIKLPWWAVWAIKGLVAILTPILDVEIGPQLEKLVTGIILQVIGSSTPSVTIQSLTKACEGVGCPVDIKKD